MGIFSSKLNSDEYERALKRISEQQADLTAMKAEIKRLDTEIASIRARKNRSAREEESEEPQKGYIPQ